MTEILDQALTATFTSFGSSVDRIATFGRVRADFLARLPPEARTIADEDLLIWRLFQLRKAGRLPQHTTRRANR